MTGTVSLAGEDYPFGKRFLRRVGHLKNTFSVGQFGSRNLPSRLMSQITSALNFSRDLETGLIFELQSSPKGKKKKNLENLFQKNRALLIELNQVTFNERKQGEEFRLRFIYRKISDKLGEIENSLREIEYLVNELQIQKGNLETKSRKTPLRGSKKILFSENKSKVNEGESSLKIKPGKSAKNWKKE